MVVVVVVVVFGYLIIVTRNRLLHYFTVRPILIQYSIVIIAYIYIVVLYICITLYIYIYICVGLRSYIYSYDCSYIVPVSLIQSTPGLHNKIPAHKIFARVCVAQESLFFIGSG